MRNLDLPMHGWSNRTQWFYEPCGLIRERPMRQAFGCPNANSADQTMQTSLPSSVPNFDSVFIILIRSAESFLQHLHQLLQRVRHFGTTIRQYLSDARRYASCSVLVHLLYTEQFWNSAQNISNGVVPSYFGGFRTCLGYLAWTYSSSSEDDVTT